MPDATRAPGKPTDTEERSRVLLPKNDDEETRLAALADYGILDTEYEQSFDDITQLVAAICDAPIAIISLIDRNRQWFKSEIGLGVRETPLDVSICAHAILQPDVFVVSDTLQDVRFASNPLVIGEPHLRSYAGALLESADGYPLGTLCVLDYKPREFSDRERDALRVLARQTMAQFELRRTVRELSRALDDQQHEQEALRQLAAVVENSTDFIGIARMDQAARFVNAAGRRLVGLDDDEDVSRHRIEEFFDPEDRPYVVREFLPALLRDGRTAAEVRFRHFETNEPIWVHCAAFTVSDPATGAPTALVTITQDIGERKALEEGRERLFAEQQRLANEERARADRESLLLMIGAAVRATDDPNEAQARAVALLGKALSLDICHATVYEPTRKSWHVTRDWYCDDTHTQTASDRSGIWPLLVEVVTPGGSVHGSEQTSAISDVARSPLLSPEARDLCAQAGVSAFVHVPLLGMAALPGAGLTAAMTAGPRDWTEGDISLLESAAALMRTAVVAARVQQRERNIAEILQMALQPLPPPDLPGMKLQGYYRPALDEAAVGGDFYDVFAVAPGCTALVVGDLSGKGLSAATEVATVRNMTRYALYTAPDLADAITNLHRVLAERNLLTGFATLFVGVFDHNRNILDYVNCGQEPALLRRAATGAIDQLPPTGPVLGGFASTVTFEQKAIALVPGDVLAVFTDGLTDAGPNRRNLLELSGVIDLLQSYYTMVNPAPPPNAQAIVDCLIAGVNAFSRGGARDDVALLVGVVSIDQIT